MEKLTIEDINKVRDCAGTSVREPERSELKHIYSKLEFICQKLTKDKFNYKIRKDPRSQGGGFKYFQNYLWAKIFPVEFQNQVWDKLALIIGISDGTLHFHIMGIGDYQNKEASQKIHENSWTELNLDNLDYDFIAQEFENFYEENRNSFINAAAELDIIFFKDLIKKMEIIEKIKLLEYKKQIILQGPPGTGKTREAKKIAEELVVNNSKVSDLKQYFKVGQKINSTSGIASYYDVLEIYTNKITIKNEKAVENREISLETINDTISQINIGQVDKSRVNYPYESALASYIIKEVKSNDQIKLIQFHPSYTYEDFVRGIVAESKGEKIEYKNVNKTLGEFAEKALKNYQINSQNQTINNKDIWINEKFEDFKNEIEKDVEEKEINLSGNINLFKVESDNFRYGKDWATPSRINFSDFKILIKAILENQLEISLQKIPKELSVHAHYRYTYYNALLKKFFENYSYQGENYSEPLKNYVLIIDEINRANLSSVLGELIYSLEYRGEAVDSMYAVENSILPDKNHLILPPNLYIIGTMNTADRSVGHIDYAIRRRFAFVDVLPEKLSETDEIYFNTTGYEAVEKLFTSDLVSNEFDVKDVQIGHSYFIAKKEEATNELKRDAVFKMKMDYEIKPILKEYLKDGIFVDGKQIDGKDIKMYIEDLA